MEKAKESGPLFQIQMTGIADRTLRFRRYRDGEADFIGIQTLKRMRGINNFPVSSTNILNYGDLDRFRFTIGQRNPNIFLPETVLFGAPVQNLSLSLDIKSLADLKWDPVSSGSVFQIVFSDQFQGTVRILLEQTHDSGRQGDTGTVLIIIGKAWSSKYY